MNADKDIAPPQQSQKFGEETDVPLARLVGLANSFELSLEALKMQIAAQRHATATDEIAARASAMAVRIIALRQNMRRIVGADLLPDSVLDVLLELFSMQVRTCKSSVMDVCAGLDMPDTTTRRWLRKLETAGLLDRCGDPADHRRDWVSLKPALCETIRLMLGHLS